MKNVLTLLTAFAFVGLVACGPSAEEKMAQEAALQQAADSVANALLEEASQMAEEPEMAAEEPAMVDSAAVAEGDAAAEGDGHEGHDHAEGEGH